MKTGSNTAPRHITTCHVKFSGALVQQWYRKTKIMSDFVQSACLAFHLNQLHMVNGIGLYIFTEFIKYEG